MPVDVAKALEKNEKLQQEKLLWNTHWQLVHEYFLQRKADFTVTREGGAFLNSDIWTSIPGKAAETCASALLGLVWPDSYSFSLQPFGELEEDLEIKDWFSDVTEIMRADMDDPEAGLTLALDEMMLDFVVSGTPAIHCEEGENSLYRFDSYSVQQFAVEEGANGFVNGIHRQFEHTISQAVEKFGLANLSPKTQERFKNNQTTEKIKILHVIEPRSVIQGGGAGAQNMPYASYYIEMDEKKLIRESGYHELPTFVVRAMKRVGEKYGRSFAMSALPDVMELNALWEIVTVGLEKNFDPPLAMYDDGTFGAGKIDTSAGAINVINVSGKIAMQQPLQPIFTVGNFTDMAALIERLEQSVNNHFLIDRLLDLDNEKEMTAREAMIRQSIRQKALRSVISRLLTELFNRLIERCFNIGLRAGRYGFVPDTPEAIAWQAANPDKEMKVIPEKISKMQGSGERVYRIRYMTPAQREQEAEQAQGILNLFEFAGNMAPVTRVPMQLLNAERATRKLGDIWSVPEDCLNDEDELKAIQERDAEQAEKANALIEGQAAAGIAKDAAMAQNAGRSATQQTR